MVVFIWIGVRGSKDSPPSFSGRRSCGGEALVITENLVPMYKVSEKDNLGFHLNNLTLILTPRVRDTNVS